MQDCQRTDTVALTERPAGHAEGVDDYDLIVLGGGAAGLAAAQAAAGARTLLISEGELGGECTFTGCVPSKALIEAAARDATFAAAMTGVRRSVAAIAATETAAVLEKHGIEVLRGHAEFAGPRELTAAGRALRARGIVLATGSRPAIPPVPGLAEVPYLTNETIFELTEPPGRLAILGGGAIGCELAQAFARLGSQVTLIETAPRLLPAADPRASAIITQALAADGVQVRTTTTVEKISGNHNDSGISLQLTGPATMAADHLLVAAGRIPVTSGLGLQAAGIRTGDHGQIITNPRLATTAPGVYAAGDCTGIMPFTHAAYAMGRIAARNALRKRWSRPARFSPDGIPWVVFTDPEVAQAGLAEEQAATRTRGARVAYLPMREVDRAVTAGRTEGFVTIISGPRRLTGGLGGGRVLGATIVAPRAGEMIDEVALAMRAGLFTGRLAQTVHAYPTWSLAIQQAAAQFFGGYGGRKARAARRTAHD